MRIKDINIRRFIKRNRGVYVILVLDDSPAYYADLLIGDIIISIEGEEINKLEEQIQLTFELPVNYMIG